MLKRPLVIILQQINSLRIRHCKLQIIWTGMKMLGLVCAGAALMGVRAAVRDGQAVNMVLVSSKLGVEKVTSFIQRLGWSR